MAGKKYRAALEKVDREKKYALPEALTLLKSIQSSKFDESVEVALRLGIDAKQTDQNVRGAIALPHGTGKSVKVLVFAKGEKEKEALDAGADYAGAEALVEKIQGGWMEFDKVVATPDLMGLVGRIGKLLGPRGLMPNPKVGTVTFEVAKAVRELKGGKVEFRNDKAGVIHAAVGKASFSAEKLAENIQAFIDAVIKAKPAASKGIYLQTAALSSTMSPGFRLDATAFMK